MAVALCSFAKVEDGSQPAGELSGCGDLLYHKYLQNKNTITGSTAQSQIGLSESKANVKDYCRDTPLWCPGSAEDLGCCYL